MRRKQYDKKDGMRVWLDRNEIELFLGQAKNTKQRIAFSLMARCGLRRNEVIHAKPTDIIDTDVGPRVRVEEAKGGRYREVPIPGELKTSSDVLAEHRDKDFDVPLVDVSSRTANRWVNRAAERCHAETGDKGWLDVGPHDLRRTWAMLLLEVDVEPGMIMEWAGWSDWETFREHYLGAYSPEMERRQAAKVPWLEGRREQPRSQGVNPRGNADMSQLR